MCYKSKYLEAREKQIGGGKYVYFLDFPDAVINNKRRS
jgi:hypothetical protein